MTAGLVLLMLAGCAREPKLHLYDEATAEASFPEVELALDVYWDYELAYGITYDWRSEWFFPWDSIADGPIGYTKPTVFNLRRYFTGDVPRAPHTQAPDARVIYGTSFSDRYRFGFWDFLVWNYIEPAEGDDVLNINIDEQTSLDFVTAFTNPTMKSTRYSAPRFTRSFYTPEPLFAAYDQGEEINENLDGFEYDEEKNVWVKQLNMTMLPVTYIYLTQVILHNNRGRIDRVESDANLSGMARSVCLNTGITGDDAITVNYTVKKKDNCDYKPTETSPVEKVDIIGGRLLSFGMCNCNPNAVTRGDEIRDNAHHYMDVKVQFNNGKDSTLVFNVTDQVRQLFKGGVITVELDMDTVPIPSQSGGSGFDAVVEDFTEETHEFSFDK